MGSLDTPPVVESAGKAVQAVSQLRPLTRILYPGLAVALFIHLRYSAPVFHGLGSESLPSIALSILLGTLVYFTYRALVLPIVWRIQSRTSGILTRETHRRLVDSISHELRGTTVRESIFFSQACLAQFQAETLTREQKADTAAYNSGSHILYLTATLGLLFFAHDIVAPCLPVTAEPVVGHFVAWILLFALGIAAGFVYDRNADYREAVGVWRNEDGYRKILEPVIRSWLADFQSRVSQANDNGPKKMKPTPHSADGLANCTDTLSVMETDERT
jgi:hypothetical protein